MSKNISKDWREREREEMMVIEVGDMKMDGWSLGKREREEDLRMIVRG